MKIITVPKKTIVVASDHTDRGAEIKNCIIKHLEERERKVISLDHSSPDDSYVKIAEKACNMIRKGTVIALRRPERPVPDSAILIDQLGEAIGAIANCCLGMIAMTARYPEEAYEFTRKNNPNVLCIPTQIWNEKEDRLVKNVVGNVIKTVDSWLDTRFLQNASLEERKRYIKRQEESLRIHYRFFGSAVRRGFELKELNMMNGLGLDEYFFNAIGKKIKDRSEEDENG